MADLKSRILSGALGASSGLAGLTVLTRCGGASCTSCFGCAGAGVGLVAIAIYHRFTAARAGGACDGHRLEVGAEIGESR